MHNRRICTGPCGPNDSGSHPSIQVNRNNATYPAPAHVHALRRRRDPALPPRSIAASRAASHAVDWGLPTGAVPTKTAASREDPRRRRGASFTNRQGAGSAAAA
eukprot:COSAG03_NODE_17840_length_367_cov_0.548507_1_plen_103_part_01